MTKAEFESKSFDEVMEQLNGECNEITTYYSLIDYIKTELDNDNLDLALFLLDAIYNDPSPYDSVWWIYDYSMGPLQTPVNIHCKEDVEHLIKD